MGRLLIGIMLLSGFAYADSAELLSANEVRAIRPSINAPDFKRIVEAIKNAALNGDTLVTVDLSDSDFKTINRYAYLLQNKGYSVDLVGGKAGLNSALRISWDISLREKGFSGNRIAPLSNE